MALYHPDRYSRHRSSMPRRPTTRIQNVGNETGSGNNFWAKTDFEAIPTDTPTFSTMRDLHNMALLIRPSVGRQRKLKCRPTYDLCMTHTWPMVDPYNTHDPYITNSWPMYDPYMTHVWHIPVYRLPIYPCMIHVTHVWPMYDPYMTNGWPIWHIHDPCMTNTWPMHDPCDPYTTKHGSYMGHMNHVWVNRGSIGSCFYGLCMGQLNHGSYMDQPWVKRIRHRSTMGDVGHVWVIWVNHGHVWVIHTWVKWVMHGSCMGHMDQ
jgi:hypothetical protein